MSSDPKFLHFAHKVQKNRKPRSYSDLNGYSKIFKSSFRVSFGGDIAVI